MTKIKIGLISSLNKTLGLEPSNYTYGVSANKSFEANCLAFHTINACVLFLREHVFRDILFLSHVYIFRATKNVIIHLKSQIESKKKRRAYTHISHTIDIGEKTFSRTDLAFMVVE